MARDTEIAMPEGGWPLVPPFRREGARGWVAALPSELHPLTDNNSQPHRSRLRLFEAQRQSGRPHASHETIRQVGRGDYSFWSDVLYFSVADGSDPNTNGRAYTVAFAPSLAEETNPDSVADGCRLGARCAAPFLALAIEVWHLAGWPKVSPGSKLPGS